MDSFRGRFTNKIDAKGRVSVPAKFRAITTAQGMAGVLVFPSLSGSMLEGCGPSFSSVIDSILDQLDPFSKERDALASALIGDSAELMFDNDGRVVIPEELRDFAGIKEEATFVGMGPKFQIWEPRAYEIFREAAREHAASNTNLLRAPSSFNRSGGGQ